MLAQPVTDGRDHAAIPEQIRTHRRDDGSYWTGIVYPEPVLFPFDEHTSYTAAAVVLAVDAITRATPASDVFVPF